MEYEMTNISLHGHIFSMMNQGCVGDGIVYRLLV